MSKVWLITGASRGLGRAFTEEALKAGHRVMATARNLEQLAEVASKFGESVRTVSLDVTNEAQAKYAVDAAIQTFGGLNVLVNNAGYGNVCPVEDTPLPDFRAQIETNLFGVIIMTKAVLPYFRERASGHIIQISSIGGRVGPAGRAAYAAAKFGVEGFSESLSKEVGPLGIKVTIVEPGAKAGRSMTQPSALPSAFNATTMASNRETRQKRQRRFCISHRYPNRRCASCLEVMLTTRPKNMLSKFLRPTESGKI
jgi:NAD(P)-dependent dehydrogenase (short-subunit alcohol dehydrogenase family)